MAQNGKQNEDSSKHGSGSSLYNEILGFRKDILRPFVLLLPLLLANLLTEWLKESLAAFQPWQAIWVVAPLAVIAWILWQITKGRADFRLRGVFAVFFVFYVLVFTIASGTSILDWQRSYRRYEDDVARNFLALNRLGDWRYWLAGKVHPKHNIVIVTIPPAETLEMRRADLRILISMAVRNNARGIFLDTYFEDEAVQPNVDELLCAEITGAEEAGVPVLVGYTIKEQRGVRRPQETAKSLSSCLPMSRHGHLLGFIDWDQSVRTIPLFFLRNPEMPALSLRAANLISKVPESELPRPENDLLQFLPPASEFPVIPYQDLRADLQLGAAFFNQFIAVGDESERDRVLTPFGVRQGVEVHAYAIHSLLTSRFIGRIPWWPHLFIIFASCYLLTVLAVQGMDRSKLVGLVAIFSGVLVSVAAASIHFWLLWVDVIYSLLAIWILLPILLGLRKINRRNVGL